VRLILERAFINGDIICVLSIIIFTAGRRHRKDGRQAGR
jgi:hypothetical protein